MVLCDRKIYAPSFKTCADGCRVIDGLDIHPIAPEQARYVFSRHSVPKADEHARSRILLCDWHSRYSTKGPGKE